MNIYVLDEQPLQAAEWLCDAHIHSAPEQHAAMLGTVWNWFVKHPPHRPSNWPSDKPFIPPSMDLEHPLVRWVMRNKSNYGWFADYAYTACLQYERRFGSRPLYAATVGVLHKPPYALIDGKLQAFVQAVPEEFLDKDPVTAYRKYYSSLTYAHWRYTPKPPWLER